jgi:NADH-quinone oxidoreductase subunit E
MILNKETIAEIKKRADRYPSRRSAILPALTCAFRQVGHLDPKIYKELARIIDVPYIEIAEAASFYTMFPKKEVGKYYIQVCHNISCALCGGDGLIEYLEEKLGIKIGETTPDKLFTIVGVECLGGCSAAPMMQVNDRYYENLTREKVDRLIEEFRAAAQHESN